MAEPMSIPSLKTLFKFPFQGAGWEKRFLVGILLTFLNFIIPFIPAMFVSGYMLEVMRRAAKGEELILPDWTDWGKLFLDGLKYTLVSLVFLLPGTLVYVVGFGFYFFTSFGFSLATGFGHNSPGAENGLLLVFMISLLIFFISMIVGPLLFFIGAIPLPAALANMAGEGSLAAGFRLRQWWPVLWKNKLGYFITWTILLGLFYMLSFTLAMTYLTCILCWVIPFLVTPLGFYMGLVYAALFGITFRESMESQAAQQPIVPAGPAIPAEPEQPETPTGTDEVSQA